MSAYRTIWRTVASLVCVTGAALATVLLPLGMLLSVFVSAVLIGGLIGAGLASVQDDVTLRRLGRDSLVIGLLSGLAAIAAYGFGRLIGPATVVLAVVLVLTAPPLVGFVVRRVAADSSGRTEVVPGLSTSSWTVASRATASPLANLTDAALCAAWTRSCRSLREATPAEALRYVVVRQQCLDELERRDPAGLRAWLESAASPAGDPRPYIASHRPAEGGDG